MAKTQKFASFALYAGGQGGCGIVFKDPEIEQTDSLRIVTVEKSAILPLLWNMKEWNVSFYANLNTSFINEDSGLKEYDSGYVDINGKFINLQAGVSYDFSQAGEGYGIESTDKEPKDRVCGELNVKEYIREGDDILSDETRTEKKENLFINVSGGASGNFGAGGSTSGSVEGGNFNLSAQSPNREAGLFFAVLSVSKIWIQENSNYCKVYLNVEISISSFFSGASNTSYYPQGNIGSIDATFLGASFNIPLYSEIGPTQYYTILESGSFSFDVEVSEYWEYKD